MMTHKDFIGFVARAEKCARSPETYRGAHDLKQALEALSKSDFVQVTAKTRTARLFLTVCEFYAGSGHVSARELSGPIILSLASALVRRGDYPAVQQPHFSDI